MDDFEKRNTASILVPKKFMHKIDHRRKKKHHAHPVSRKKHVAWRKMYCAYTCSEKSNS